MISLPCQRFEKMVSAISVEFTVSQIKDQTGNLMGLVAIMRDVTKQFQEMRALKRQLAQR